MTSSFSSYDLSYDVIVVGGGHAGMEAAYISARMGVKTALVTLSKEHIGLMPCNPSLGGLGKGHIVYEVAALGGLMPQLASQTYLQARMLNTRKGPAVQGLRLQIDKYAYKKEAQKRLSTQDNLTIIEGKVEDLYIDTEPSLQVSGVKVRVCKERSIYQKIEAPRVIITAGTFLNGVLHTGDTQVSGGRVGEDSVTTLSQSLHEILGVTLGRLKTGTPPRLAKESIDYSQLEQQEVQQIDYLYEFLPPQGGVEEKAPCFIAHTNKNTHDIIQKNINRSAMYSGNIVGVGPRYCPSIEDKVGRYPERYSHHVFVEPEGLSIDEVYPSGLSTSLPTDVQHDYITSIVGFEKAVITKPGYAVEYDFIQPTMLQHTLETKKIAGLFFAGQINGTTGYEEAAGQGIIAGINAAQQSKGDKPFILSREESYIGVMIDDLITLGVDEPYRMFTSRAERRLLLRQDNVFSRLMPYGFMLGTVDTKLYDLFLAEEQLITRAVQEIQKNKPHGKLYKQFQKLVFDAQTQRDCKELLVHVLGENYESLSSRALLQIYSTVRYDGYIQKEEREVVKMQQFRELAIPRNFAFDKVEGLSFELKAKLKRHTPATIAQLQLIPGMTPAAISVIIFHIRNVSMKKNVDQL